MAAAALVATAAGASAVSAATLIVDNTTASQCKKGAVYGTVQEAVDASVTNGTVIVCPGTYPEQVTITTTGLKLLANTNGTATITPGPVATGQALIEVDDADDVQVRGLVVQGPIGPEQSGIRYGIWVHGGALNARVLTNRIADIAPDADPGGIGIAFGDQSTDEVATGIVQDNVVSAVSYDGIAAFGPGVVANLTRNRIKDASAAADLVFGIDVFGARATLLGNTVTGYDYGIGLTAAESTRLTGNTLTGNEVGLGLTATDGAVVKSTSALGGGSGLVVDSGSVGNKFQANKAEDNDIVDCADLSSGSGTGGTANTWLSNKGALADPDPICS